MAVFALLKFPKLISRKIWAKEKLWNFYNVNGKGLNFILFFSFNIHMKLPKDFGTQSSILSVFHKTPTPLDRLQHMLSSAWFNAFVQITKDRGVILKTGISWLDLKLTRMTQFTEWLNWLNWLIWTNLSDWSGKNGAIVFTSN